MVKITFNNGKFNFFYSALFFIFFIIETGYCEEKNTKSDSPAPSTNKCRPDKIRRIIDNSPFDTNYKPPVYKKGKQLWANSFLWTKPPEFVVEKWLTKKPDMKGKYILIEFWATWCSQCRKAAPILNKWHSKFKDELVVVGISDEPKEKVQEFKKMKMEYYSAIDTKARMKNKIGVVGIPHIIIIEPGGYVVWEGFLFLKGYELTDKIIEKILKVGRKEE